MTVQSYFDSLEYGPAPEGRAQVDDWLAAHKQRFGLFIGGTFSKARGSQTLSAVAPATGETLATLSVASDKDVTAAVAAARAAQPGWAGLGGHGRARYLYALARAIQKHSRLLAVLESLDNGKPIRETRDLDIPLAARHFYHHAGWAQVMDSELAGYAPLGVAGQVIPWNFPLLMLAWKVAPALAAGNTVVLKPAEFTSLTALRFAEICMEVGLPAGVFNLLTGAGETGAALVGAAVDKVAFTGSTEVGKTIRRQVAGSGKKLTLELGGKSPYIVFEDADIDSAIEGLVDAIWFNQGEVCCAGSRLLVQEGIAEDFYTRLKTRMQSLRVGDSLDKCIDVGAVVDQVQKDRIEGLLKAGAEEGAEVWQAPCELPSVGVFLAPTLVTSVGPDNILMREEIFGPVLTAMSFRTQSEAVALANNTRYGLAATVWSESLGRALEVAPALKAGVIWINGTNMFDAAVGFGGYRESGFGREGGREGMLAYLKPDDEAGLKPYTPIPQPAAVDMPAPGSAGAAVDRTQKHYIGGKQARPDGGDSLVVADHKGGFAGTVARGNRKDIRNAVEAAVKAAGWAGTTAHLKAQILYYIGENLAARADELIARLRRLTGASAARARAEVEASIDRWFTAAAYADKFDGQVHSPPMRGVALAMKEPVGVLGIACPDTAPLLAFSALVSHAVAMGNRVVVLPSARYPLLATDMIQVFETSDLPAGVVNIVTGGADELLAPLARHYGVEGLWHFGTAEEAAAIERDATDNMKRTWLAYGKAYDWTDTRQTAGRALLEHAVEIKNIWVPYGDMNEGGKSY